LPREFKKAQSVQGLLSSPVVMVWVIWLAELARFGLPNPHERL
jgi:hypothetical protein